jgi:hypothetical protein
MDGLPADAGSQAAAFFDNSEIQATPGDVRRSAVRLPWQWAQLHGLPCLDWSCEVFHLEKYELKSRIRRIW